jgi:GxxExxY protein
MDEKQLSGQIIGAAIEVHRTLGPGLIESIYESALAIELLLRGIISRRQVDVPISYKGHLLSGHLRLDLFVADAVIVEVKSVERILGVHEAQLLSYLRLTDNRLGLLINFNSAVVKDGITRRVL